MAVKKGFGGLERGVPGAVGEERRRGKEELSVFEKTGKWVLRGRGTG